MTVRGWFYIIGILAMGVAWFALRQARAATAQLEHTYLPVERIALNAQFRTWMYVCAISAALSFVTLLTTFLVHQVTQIVQRIRAARGVFRRDFHG
jgi:hypothetical protein